MSNTEIVLDYIDPAAVTGKKILLFTSPLWVIVAPIVAIYLLFAGMSGGFQLSFAGFGVIILMILCGLGTIACGDNRIIISKRGIRVPVLLTIFAMGRAEIPWSTISSLEIIEDRKFDPDEAQSKITKELVFHLNDKDEFRLRLHQLSKEHVEQLVLSLSLWLDPATCKLPDLGLVKEDKLLKKAQGKGEEGDMTFTQLWQKEMESRYTSTAFMPLEPDQTIRDGRLKIVRQISFGGLSAVYLCQEDRKDLRILKESVVPYNSKPELKEKAAQMFKREASLLVKISHPQIARVLDYFSEEDRSYMLLAYEEGRNLRQLVREQGVLSEEMVAKTALYLCGPLKYLHDLSPPVVHRDISPENIILKEDDTPVLIDFGAANEFLGTATGTLVGKQCYISPEQFKGKAGTASDLYSLGATLYFLLTGDDPVPISSSSPRAVRAEISEEMDAIICALTELEVEERIKSADELTARLTALLDKPAVIKINS